MLFLGKFLAILSGVLYAAGYLDYIRKVLNGRIHPNGATWSIWSAIALMNAATYLASSGDFWKTIIPLTNIGLVLFLLVLCLCHKKFQRLGWTDWLALCLGLGAIAVWKLSAAAYANFTVQLAIAIGFIPTWASVRRNPHAEQPRPWWLWAASYAVMLAVVLLRWNGQWSDLVCPINCTILHASVAIQALMLRRAKKISPYPEILPK